MIPTPTAAATARPEPRGDPAGSAVPARTVVVVAGVTASLLGFRGPLLRAMTERGHRVVALAPEAGDKVRHDLAKIGVEFRAVPLAHAALGPVDDLGSLRALRRQIVDICPDAVFAYTIKPIVYGLLAARLAGVPLRFGMITGRGWALGGEGLRARVVGAGVRALLRPALAGARCVLFQNPDDEAAFREAGLLRRAAGSRVVAGSGIDLDQFRPQPLPDRPRFLMVARLVREKGVREYVDAARIVAARYPQAEFHLIGFRDQNPNTIPEAELASWLAGTPVELSGWTEDVRPALAACSAFVLPSYYAEGTPRSTLEALATGRPAITADMPGCRETVKNGVNGFLVPPRDPAALAAAMTRLIEDPARARTMAAAGLELARSRFDVRLVNADILAVMGLA